MTDWVTRPDENGQPRTSRPAPDIWNRLSGRQQQVVDTILDQNAKRADVTTDPKVRDAIMRGLSSADAQERAKWARVPLYEYKPSLSDSDFRTLADRQRQISPYDGTPREGLGHPIGTLDQNAEAAIALTSGRFLRPVLGIGRAALGRLRGTAKSQIEEGAPSPDWPANRGFEGEPSRTTLAPGARVDRYGGPGGNFLAPEGTPVEARSLPPGTESRPLMVYEVVKPFEVNAGPAAPYYNQPGGGLQYDLGKRTVQDLIDSGHLRPIK